MASAPTPTLDLDPAEGVLGDEGPPRHHRHLAHVARPRVAIEQLEAGVVEVLVGRHLAARRRAQEMVEQRPDVLAPIAQRGQRDGQDRQAVVEVFAEPALPHGHLEVAVGGRDDAQVDVALHRVAQAVEGALGQQAQQLGLGGHGQVAHLVEEEGAAVGRRGQSLAVGLRAAEGALDVAEELPLEHGVGDRGHVHGHERLVGAGALAVDQLRHHLLAGAGLAGQQDGLVVGREHVDRLQRLLHGPRFGDHHVARHGADAGLAGAPVAAGVLRLLGATPGDARLQPLDHRVPVVDVERAAEAEGHLAMLPGRVEPIAGFVDAGVVAHRQQHLGRHDAGDGMLVPGVDRLELFGGPHGVVEGVVEVPAAVQALGEAAHDDAFLEAVAQLAGLGARLRQQFEARPGLAGHDQALALAPQDLHHEVALGRDALADREAALVVAQGLVGPLLVAVDVAEELERQALLAGDGQLGGHRVGGHEVLAGDLEVAGEAVDVA
ncbi:MAG: hypothetical protein R3D98_14830 [Candidatus Krumholzibacteriia bacterium]